MPKTVQEAAKLALDIQNACNLSGVIHTFCEVLQDVVIPSTQATIDVNQHPITKLFASKIHDLAGMGLSDFDEYRRAYDACLKLAEVD